MSLRDLPIRSSYRSDDCNLVADFYIPCFNNSVRYKRAVGFFSSSALTIAAKGLHPFLQSDGKVQLIASPHISREDAKAIEDGYRSRAAVVEESVLRSLEEPFDQVLESRLDCLAWMIQKEILEIKLALVTPLGSQGIYHEKVGIFESQDGDYVAFSGSPNESATGLIHNFEAIDVFCSWKPEDEKRALSKARQFATLWSNDTSRLEILPFPEAARRKLLTFRSEIPPCRDPEEANQGERARNVPELLPGIELRSYQNKAIDNWLAAGGRGILEMATGSGKTFTALGLAARLYAQDLLQATVIVVPYRHLVTQWIREARKFGLEPLACMQSRDSWLSRLQTCLYNLNRGEIPFASFITTNSTFHSTSFQAALRNFPHRTLIVGDEAHNLGAQKLSQALPENIKMRLGLSATPERHSDPEGTAALFDYFGGIIEPRFTLQDALENGALVPYRYYPVPVELTPDEAEDYFELTEKIAKAWGPGSDSNSEEGAKQNLKFLLIRRARLLASASNKLVALRGLVQTDGLSHALIYCGDGTVESDMDAAILRQVEAVTRLLGTELGLKVSSYTAETELEERDSLRTGFASGMIQALVAIRCLDEGVDIPETRVAFILASSTNPRQFIQRRGRVLRPSPGKKRAEIFDMVVVPPASDRTRGSKFTVERNMIAKELKRVLQFAALAENATSARNSLLKLRQEYHLLDL